MCIYNNNQHFSWRLDPGKRLSRPVIVSWKTGREGRNDRGRDLRGRCKPLMKSTRFARASWNTHKKATRKKNRLCDYVYVLFGVFDLFDWFMYGASLGIYELFMCFICVYVCIMLCVCHWFDWIRQTRGQDAWTNAGPELDSDWLRDGECVPVETRWISECLLKQEEILGPEVVANQLRVILMQHLWTGENLKPIIETLSWWKVWRHKQS